jgi:sugar lactone lactonase YvrE
VHTLTIHDKTFGTTRRTTGLASASGWLRAAGATLAVALGSAFLAPSLEAQVPAAVASSQITLANGINSGRAVTDACGDVYINQNNGSGGIIEIQAGTGTVTTIAPNTAGYNGGPQIYMDYAKANLYFPDPTAWYTTHFDQVPINNCVPGGINNTFGSNLSSLANYYWGTANDIAGDKAGDVYFITTANATNVVYAEILTTPATSSSSAVYTPYAAITWSNPVSYISADPAGNVYFVDNTTQNVYFSAYTAGSTPSWATPVVFAAASHFSKIVGLSFDPAGNLFVSDGGTAIIYRIPLVSGKLTPADLTAVVAINPGDGVQWAVQPDAQDDLYLSNYYPGAIEILADGATGTNTAVAGASTLTVSYVFNTTVTPTAIGAVTGTATSTSFSAGSGCTVGTAYAALSSCSETVNFTPKKVGSNTGALLFVSSAGTVTSQLSGVGLGAAVNIDPGTVTDTTTIFKAPAGVAVDNVGNVYVTDSTANTLTEFPAGSNGTGTVVSTGSLTLSGPLGVAVDNQGDIYIADTGNNRIVEIPVVNGTVDNAATAALTVKVTSPQGVATDLFGDLLIADTGANELVYVPNVNGTLNQSGAADYGTSLNGPSAVAVDANGNVYVAETGNKDVLKFAAPFGSAAQVVIASGLGKPTGLSTDASGAVFVADEGAGSVLRYPNVGGNFGASTFAGSTILSPFGVATDASGDLYVTDTTDAVAAEINRVQAASNFFIWNVGTTSDPLTSEVLSAGNTSLTFSSPSYVPGGNLAAGFSVTDDGCAGQTLLPGGSCGITATFTPPIAEMNAQENLVLASNAINGAPTVELIGTGAMINASTVSVTLTSPTGQTTLKTGESVTFTATIGTGSSTTAAGGSVEFYVNGVEAGTSAVSSNSATLTLPNGLPGLSTPGETDTILAVYSGDDKNYSGSQGSTTVVVVALPDTITLSVVTPYNNPLSANDSAANANGPAIPLIATVAPSGSIAPGGTVTFYSGSTALGSASVLPVSGGGYEAQITTTALRAGTTSKTENGSYYTVYNITAVYSGDKTYANGTSGAVTVTIVGADPTANTASPNTTGAFFNLSPSNPTISISSTKAGGPTSGAVNIAINSYGGWDGILNFTCSGLPKYATCNPFPGYPNGVPSKPGANIPPTQVDFIINDNVAPVVPTGTGSMVWWVSGGLGLMLMLMRRRIKRNGFLRTGQLITMVGAVLVLGSSALGLSGCGSGGYSYITPAGTYQVTVAVSAAQLNTASGTTGATYPPDVDVPSFTITLTVQ